MLVPAARPLRSRSRLSPVTNAGSTAGKGRGRLRPPAQTPVAMHRGRLPQAREHGPHQVARAGDAAAIFPRAPSRVPIPPDLRERRQPAYLQQERASAPPTAAASWSRTRRRRRGTNHFCRTAATGRWHGSRAGEALEIPAGTVGCRPLGASLPGICAELAAAGRLSIHSVCPTARALVPQAREPAACRAQLPGSTQNSPF